MLAKLFSMLEYSTTPLDTNPFTEQIVGEWSLPDEVCFSACPPSPVHFQHFCRSQEMMKRYWLAPRLGNDGMSLPFRRLLGEGQELGQTIACVKSCPSWSSCCFCRHSADLECPCRRQGFLRKRSRHPVLGPQRQGLDVLQRVDRQGVRAVACGVFQRREVEMRREGVILGGGLP
jgi:hypothetical protein